MYASVIRAEKTFSVQTGSALGRSRVWPVPVLSDLRTDMSCLIKGNHPLSQA